MSSKAESQQFRSDLEAESLSSHIWERLIWTCHSAFFITLVISAAVALTNSAATWSDRSVLLGLTFSLIAWFLAGTMAGLFSRQPLPSTLVYFVLGLSALGALMAFHTIYILVAFGLAWQMMLFLPTRWAVLGMLTFTVTITLVIAAVEGGLTDTGRSIGLPMFSAIAMIYFVGTIMNQSRERQRLIEDLQSTRAELASSERQAGVLEERQRLAREIHDTLAQGFTSIVMHMETAESLVPSGSSEVHKHIDQVRRTARESLAEARRLVWALQPPALEGVSLPDAIGRLAQNWANESGITVSTAVTGAWRPQHPEMEVTMLRAAQEALANIRKHAQASQVTVTLSYMEDVLVLDVQDDGVGFDPTQKQEIPDDQVNGGFGLKAMRQRVEQLRGRVFVESTPGEGTTLVAEIPIVLGVMNGHDDSGDGRAYIVPEEETRERSAHD